MPASRFPTAQVPSISVALFFTARVRFIFPPSIFPETFTSRKSLLLVPSTALPVIVPGIANAVSRLKDSKAKSKVIILLTDGTNNAGDISPLTAAEIAKSFGIRVYTIGVGTNGLAPYPMPVAGGVQYLNVPVEIDTKTLAAIAGKTDGEFYRATDNKKLEDVYKDIDKLEKTKLNVKQYSKRYEAYALFAWLAAVALLLEILLRMTILKKIP